MAGEAELHARIAELEVELAAAKARTATAEAALAAAGLSNDIPTQRGVLEGDHAICMWQNWTYYPGTVHSFDADARTFGVAYDDGDTGSTDSEQVYLDVPPAADAVRVGTDVVFIQGSYNGVSAEAARAAALAGEAPPPGKCPRWHLGRITGVVLTSEGPRYSGYHLKNKEEDGKYTSYRNFDQRFESLPLDQLRVATNFYEIVSSSMVVAGGKAAPLGAAADICFCSVANGKVPEQLAAAIEAEGWALHRTGGGAAGETVQALQSCRLAVFCISDEFASDTDAVMLLQFVKKTLRKHTVCCVVGSGWDWMQTTVGLLVAGELFIDFTRPDQYDAKLLQLLDAVDGSLGGCVAAPPGVKLDTSASSVVSEASQVSVMVSYCWSNSSSSFRAGEVGALAGHELVDPRSIAASMKRRGMDCWLDVERMGGGGHLFDAIAQGLKACQVVIACVSNAYAASPNCQMEFKFAAKILKRPIVAVIVDSGAAWQSSVVGLMLAGASDFAPLDLQSCCAARGKAGRDEIFDEIEACVLEQVGVELPMASLAVSSDRELLAEGVHVISHYSKWGFFPGTIGAFDRTKHTFDIDYDDGDKGTTQYDLVALDRVPDLDELGVGTQVVFMQGRYKDDPSDPEHRAWRWHLGVIESGSDGVLRGRHLKNNEDDGKWVEFKGYEREWELPPENLRVLVNVMEALEAFE